MKKTLIVTLCVILVLAISLFAACDPQGIKVNPDKQHYVVGICQLVQHDALDDATEGFIDALTAELEKEGRTVEFDTQNANNEPTMCSTIISTFVSKNVDLIMANATSPLQAAAAATSSIPVLGTSVTDYATALEIENWTGVVGNNISGTSDLAPLDRQADMITELFPDTQKVAILYCSGEPNSKYQATEMAKYLAEKDIETKEFSFADTNDVTSVTQNACEYADVIYVPTDNTAASNTEAITNVVLPAGVPVVAGEKGICTGCGVATLSISYYDIGYQTGVMAAQVLLGKEDITKMAIATAPEVTKLYNERNCETLGVTVPEGYSVISGTEAE